jgi:hypothetical protein
MDLHTIFAKQIVHRKDRPEDGDAEIPQRGDELVHEETGEHNKERQKA